MGNIEITLTRDITDTDSLPEYFNNYFGKDTSITNSIVYVSDNLTDIPTNYFNGFFLLKEVRILKNIRTINSFAFNNCTSLTTVSFFEGNTVKFEEILANAFKGCTSLTSVTIPSTVIFIGSAAFFNCSSLVSFIYPTPTLLTEISNSCFENCSKLVSITIPMNVVRIGNNAFSNCINLTTVQIPTTTTQIGSFAFKNCFKLKDVKFPNANINSSSLQLTVPALANDPKIVYVDGIQTITEKKNFQKGFDISGQFIDAYLLEKTAPHFVDVSNVQTIDGLKTFEVSPHVPDITELSTPSSAVNKGYVETLIDSIKGNVSENYNTLEKIEDALQTVVSENSGSTHNVTFTGTTTATNLNVSGSAEVGIVSASSITVYQTVEVGGNVTANSFSSTSNAITLGGTSYALSEYLKSADASSVYLRQNTAASTYATNAALSNFVTDVSTNYMKLTGSAQTVASNINFSTVPTILNVNVATETFVTNSVASIVGSAPEVLDTIGEIAAAMNGDASFVINMNSRLIDISNSYVNDTTFTNAISQNTTAINDVSGGLVLLSSKVTDISNNYVQTTQLNESNTIINNSISDLSGNVNAKITALQDDVNDISNNYVQTTQLNESNTIINNYISDLSGNVNAKITALQDEVNDISNNLQLINTVATGDFSILQSSIDRAEQDIIDLSNNYIALNTKVIDISNNYVKTTTFNTNNVNTNILITDVSNNLASVKNTVTNLQTFKLSVSAFDLSVNQINTRITDVSNNLQALNTNFTQNYSTTNTSDSKYLRLNPGAGVIQNILTEVVFNASTPPKVGQNVIATEPYVDTKVANLLSVGNEATVTALNTLINSIASDIPFFEAIDASLTEINANYLSTTQASSIYLNKTDASSIYLKINDATNAYLTKDAANDYLKSSVAEVTYATIGYANDTYATKADLNAIDTASYLTTTDANNIYLTQDNAALTYASQASLSDYLTIANASNYALSANTVNLAGIQTISGTKTFSGTTTFDGSANFNNYLILSRAYEKVTTLALISGVQAQTRTVPANTSNSLLYVDASTATVNYTLNFTGMPTTDNANRCYTFTIISLVGSNKIYGATIQINSSPRTVIWAGGTSSIADSISGATRIMQQISVLYTAAGTHPTSVFSSVSGLS